MSTLTKEGEKMKCELGELKSEKAVLLAMKASVCVRVCVRACVRACSLDRYRVPGIIMRGTPIHAHCVYARACVCQCLYIPPRESVRAKVYARARTLSLRLCAYDHTQHSDPSLLPEPCPPVPP